MNASRHLPAAAIERGFAALPAPPADTGRLALVVARGAGGARATPARTTVTPLDGLTGDRWTPDRRVGRSPTGRQITAMRIDVARLFANGQDPALTGDNLLVDLDLAAANLPPGSRLRVGGALLVLTPDPHTGCAKFRERFGAAALQFTAAPDRRHLRLRGVHLRVVEAGEIAVGDEVHVVERGRGID